jgi:hypothetical protein
MVPIPAAIDAPAPPDEPAHVIVPSQGFIVAPCSGLSVKPRIENSGVLVRPMMIAPDFPRLGFTNQYCQPWARPQENFFHGVPAERVRNMSREMQILLGYELLRPAHIMGQVSGYHPSKTLDPEFVLPVLR